MKKIFSMLIVFVLLSTMAFAQGGVTSKTIPSKMIVVQDDDSAKLYLMQQQTERFMEENQERFRDCELNCEVNVQAVGNQTQIRTTRESQFLFWKVNAVDTLEINEDGEVTSQQGNIWQWMFDRNWIKVKTENIN